MFNVFAIVLVLERYGLVEGAFPKETSLLGTIIFIAISTSYYLIGGRYKRIYEKYVNSRKSTPSTLKSVIVVALWYLLSCGLLFISALFKNQDWIFAK